MYLSKDKRKREEHLKQAKKLEFMNLIKISVDQNSGILNETTKLGISVSDNIKSNGELQNNIPLDIADQIISLKESINREFNLTLPEYLLLKYRSNGTINRTDGEFPSDTVDVVKKLSNKGYIKYDVSDFTFNNEPSKLFKWFLTEKGKAIKVKLNEYRS